MGSSSDREKDALLTYKYVSPPLSICERLWLDKFWDWTAEQYPRWVAPNVITLTGFAMILTSATLIFCYSPSLEGDAPSWVYLVCAACIFGYQTLDGSDGKQARRTKSGGPLGELCDHGCDALCSILLPLACFDGMGFTWNHPLTIATFVGAQSAFMLSNMVLCHTGRQMFFEFDAMEIELSAIAGLIVSGVFTTAVWKQTSFAFPIPSAALAALGPYGQKLRLAPPAADGSQDLTLYLRDVRYFVVLFMPINLCRYLYKMFSFYLAGKVNKVFSDMHRQTLSDLLQQLVLLLVLNLSMVFAWLATPSDAVSGQKWQIAWVIASCFAFGELMLRLLSLRIAARKLPYAPFHVPTLLIFAFGAAQLALKHEIGGAAAHLYLVQLPWVITAAVVTLHVAYAYTSAQKFCGLLGIKALSIPYTPKAKGS